MLPHQISLAEAIELTTRFRNNPGPNMPLSETFGKNSVDALLAQPGCVSFRIYLGRKEDNSICSILVAADAEGNDIIPSSVARTDQPGEDDDDDIILENAFHCPPACPPPSLLNG